VAVVTASSPDGNLIIYCNGTNVVIRPIEVRDAARAVQDAPRPGLT
jgi:hypothetical protein